MKDEHRIAHFDLKATRPEALSEAESRRIRETAALVPSHWRRIVDVGCGDGRVSRELLARGHDVVGIDWSRKSLEQYPGSTKVCDIRKSWPFDAPFDGAICCEVLEHLLPEEASQVIAQIKANTTAGFLITVPAREPLESHIVNCQACQEDYHIWGHCRAFGGFKSVDRMVGQRSTRRQLIGSDGRVTVPNVFAQWRRRHSFYPYDPSYLCPNCGAPLREPLPPTALNRVINKGISLSAYLLSPLHRKGGWFACRYVSGHPPCK